MATLLIAEDHPDALAMLTIVFLSDGYRVVTACDGVEAVAAFEQHAPDIVLMDLCMPALDGLAAAKRIRAFHSRGHIPIIAFTADPAMLKGQTHLFNRICVKPCEPVELMNIVREVLADDHHV